VQRRRFTALLLGVSLHACCRPASNAPATSPRAAEPSATKTIYIVRHAEKAVREGERDPELTDGGEARALALRQRLAQIEGDTLSLYSSQYRRTMQTLAPIATLKGLTITSYDPAAGPGPLAEALRADPASNVLVAGHSNTIPALLEALGASPESMASVDLADPMGESRYGDLFVLTISGDAVSLRAERFGADLPA